MNEPTLTIIILTIIFFAAFEQSLVGFGFSLIAMPLATMTLGLQTAAPLVALASWSVNAIHVVRYREALNFKQALPLALASAFGIPIGLWSLVNVSESLIKGLLGVILIAYGLYSLAHSIQIELHSRGWAFLAGFVSGCLSGAYNTGGPPLVVYGSLKRWQKDEFRAVVQSLFLFNNSMTVVSHTFAGNMTPTVLTFTAFAIPAVLLAVVLGARFDRFVDKERFRKLVIAMILILGVSLVVALLPR